jgi:hypothetical protein
MINLALYFIYSSGVRFNVNKRQIIIFRVKEYSQHIYGAEIYGRSKMAFLSALTSTLSLGSVLS